MAGRVLEEKPVVQDTEGEDNAPANESKADCFRRLANKRVTVALDKIRLIGNLSSRGNYEYTDEQVARIEATLLEAIAFTMNQFKPKSATKRVFEL